MLKLNLGVPTPFLEHYLIIDNLLDLFLAQTYDLSQHVPVVLTDERGPS